MSDEEKKAIEYLKQNNIVEIQYDNYGLESIHRVGIDEKQIVLNLIEKQSKEIEELKKNNETQPDCVEPVEKTEEMVNMRWVNYNYIGKEKLKARIEEYKNKIKKIRSKKLINEPEDTIIITRYAHYISVLQSILEKEE